jgi:hypothetical protein
MVLYLVWDSESEATKESTLLSTGMTAVDDEDSDDPKPKRKKHKKSSSDDDSDESSEDDVESKEGWGKADFTCRRHVSIIRSVLFFISDDSINSSSLLPVLHSI